MLLSLTAFLFAIIFLKTVRATLVAEALSQEALVFSNLLALYLLHHLMFDISQTCDGFDWSPTRSLPFMLEDGWPCT